MKVVVRKMDHKHCISYLFTERVTLIIISPACKQHGDTVSNTVRGLRTVKSVPWSTGILTEASVCLLWETGNINESKSADGGPYYLFKSTVTLITSWQREGNCFLKVTFQTKMQQADRRGVLILQYLSWKYDVRPCDGLGEALP